MIGGLMSGAILDLIQLIGSVLLQIVTLGRYARVRPKDAQLLEGMARFLLLTVVIWGLYRVIA